MQPKSRLLIRPGNPRPATPLAQSGANESRPLAVRAGTDNPQHTLIPQTALPSPPVAPVQKAGEHALFGQGSLPITRYRVHKLGFLGQYGPRCKPSQFIEILTNLRSLRNSSDGSNDPESVQALATLAMEAGRDNAPDCNIGVLTSDDPSLDTNRVNALVAANRPPAAHLTPPGVAVQPQLGSSLGLSRLFDTTQWTPEHLLDLHMLAFYEMTPPGEMNQQIRGWFKGTCARVREQALRAGEPRGSRAMKDFEQRMARIADSIRAFDQQQHGNDERSAASETKRVRRDISEPTAPETPKATVTTTSTSNARPVLALPVVQLGDLPRGEPAASRRLVAAYGQLQRAFQPPAQIQPVGRLARGVRDAFQEAAHAALAQDRMDVYQLIEAAAASWMDQARQAVKGALAPGKTMPPDLFDLMTGAPSDLIVAMQSRSIALAMNLKAPEGGEIDTIV